MSKKTTSPNIPGLWEDSSLRGYLGEIRYRHGIVETLALPSMRDLPPLRIETLFVQPLLAESPVSADSDPATWPEGKSLLETLQEHRQLVVLGDPGGGKTTLSNWLAWRLSAGLTTPLPPVLENRLPLPCVLREMPTDIFKTSVTITDLAESIATRLLGSKADDTLKASLRARVEAGSYVLILDGVDEIPVAHRKIVAEWIKSAHLQEACVLATSRIVGYEDWPVDRSSNELYEAIRKFSVQEVVLPSPLINAEPNIASIFNALKSQTSDSSRQIKLFESANISPKQLKSLSLAPLAWAQLRYLMPFDQRRIAAFVENWYHQRCGSEQEARQKTGDLLASLAQSDATRQLARTPNLLGLMAIVHRERAHLPDGKALLYDEIANAYINTIDAQRKIPPGDILARYSWEERRAWLAYVGFQMQQLRNPLQMHSEKSEKGVLASEKDVLDWLAEAMKLAEVEQPKDTAKLFLKWVARRSGLLLPRGEGRYAFVHLSFQEYFCAWHLYGVMDHPDFTNGVSADNAVANIRKKLPSWSLQASWRETLIYLFELLSAKRNPHWVKILTDILFETNAESPNLYGNRAALAARLLTDRHIRLGEQKRDQLAERCCDQAWQDWRISIEHDSFVLSALRDTGYAAIVGSTQPREALNSPAPPGPDFSSFDEIADKTRLRLCIVMDSDIGDIAPLAGLDNLRILHFDNTQISDVAPLAGLFNLRILDLAKTKVANIAPLAGLVNLKQLDLAETKVANITPLTELVNLEQLNLSGTKIKNISPLATLDRLTGLFLGNTRVADIGPLAGLSNLRWLGLDNTPVADIASLAGLTKLTGLFLSHTRLSDISILSEASQLEYLILDHTSVSDVTPLAGLTQLYSLDLEHTPVTDVTPLSGLFSLRRLHLGHTRVSDVAPLAKLTGLKSLSLADTHVTDITPLAKIKQLEITGLPAKATPVAKPRKKKLAKK
jgi:hypothetical protein